MAGRWVKNTWHGPPRTHTKGYFERWANNLFLGINDADAAKIKKTIMVQHDGGYQNEFLFAERLPETAPVWDVLRPKEISALPDIKYQNAKDETKPINIVKEALLSRGLKSETKPSVEMEDGFFLKVTDMYGQEEVNAIRSNDVESLRKLSADGTNLECGNRFGETIIHLACRRSHRDLVKFLIDEVGVSVRVCDDYGRTPMHDACWRAEPDLELLDMLIDRAPELLMLSDKRGHTPLDYARREHWSVLVPFLRERTAKFQPV